MKLHRLMAALVPALVLAGCAHHAAVSMFSQATSCPNVRVEAAAVEPPAPSDSPPGAIARDPDRLAIWQQTRDDEQAQRARDDWYRVSGCGATAVVRCTYHSRGGERCLPADLGSGLALTFASR